MDGEVRKKIYSLAESVSGLSGFYYEEAPMPVTYPYGIFLSLPFLGSKDSVNNYEDGQFQISLYGYDLNALETIYESFRAKFDDSEASFTGLISNKVLNVLYLFSRQSRPNELWQIDIMYKIAIQKI